MAKLGKVLVMVALGALVSGCGTDGAPAASSSTISTTPPAPAPAPTATRTIVFVWDGLRPDDVTAADTPNLYAMQQGGVQFADNHSTYPTFTMMNGAAFATGSFPGTTGFYGNTFWTPPQNSAAGAANTIPSGNGAGGTPATMSIRSSPRIMPSSTRSTATTATSCCW